jgi:hypothetical protein
VIEAALFSWYGKGLLLMLLVFPIFTYLYDRAAFKEDFWLGHMLVIMVLYPVSLPAIVGLRIAR